MSYRMVGILGGMGPFASAEFVNTIYEQNLNPGAEQKKPRLFLCSDPNIPDRTTCIEAGEEEAIVDKLVELWEKLHRSGIERLIIPCLTSHYYMDRFPEEMRNQLVNLVDLTLDEVRNTDVCYLLLATNGTYQSDLLAHERIVVPTAEDQQLIHDIIYSIKQYGGKFELMDGALREVLALMRHYGTDGWICGCTEFHLLTRHVIREREELVPGILDPLLVVARRWSTFALLNEGERETIVT